MPLEQTPARMLWYDLATSTRKIYTAAINRDTKYCALFEKRPLPAQVGGLAAWIGHLRGKKLKPKTFKGYMAGFCFLCLDSTLNMAMLEVYIYPILQKMIAGLQRLYRDGDTHGYRPITWNILLRLISRFDQTTFEGANPNPAFCLAFARFLRIGKFTYNKVESNFRSWNLPCSFLSLQED